MGWEWTNPKPRLQKQLTNLPEQRAVGDVNAKRRAERLLGFSHALSKQRHQAQVSPHLGVGVVEDVRLRQGSLRAVQVACRAGFSSCNSSSHG